MIIGKEQIINPGFWNDLWQGNLKEHLGKDSAQQWNKKANTFKKAVSSQEGKKRIEAVISFLRKNNALWEGMKILDVGCGPGNFSIPFAQMGAEVIALDPAENMLKILEDEIKEKNLKNIQVIKGLWEDINIKEIGWYKQFDLVFASQSPALQNIENLQKLMDCSKKYCFGSGFDGKRQVSLYDNFCQKYFDSPYMKNSSDIIYLFNLLYFLNYRPVFEFINLSREEQYSFEQALQNIREICKEKDENSKITDENIIKFIEEKMENGTVNQYIRQVMGVVLWEV